MDVREKLVELSDIQVLQREIECVKRKSATNCADCLNCDLLMTDDRILSAYANAIAALQNANGVTVQEWISVDDMLPEPFVSVLVQMPGEEPFHTVREGFISNDGIWQSAMFRREPGEVTYWKPMPQPPKGE